MNGRGILSPEFGAACAAIRLTHLTMECGAVPKVSLRLLRTGNDRFDVEIHIDLDYVEKPAALASALHTLARGLAGRNAVTNYFAGLEPAVDENTRLFTGDTVGPLRFSPSE